MTYESARSMPIVVRKWWIARKNKDIEEANRQQKATPHVDPFGRKHSK